MSGFDNAQSLQGELRVPAGPALQDLAVDHEAARYSGQGTPGPVSYTHLTLPTICSV